MSRADQERASLGGPTAFSMRLYDLRLLSPMPTTTDAITTRIVAAAMAGTAAALAELAGLGTPPPGGRG